MSEVWFTSDHHFGHRGALRFRDLWGFGSVEEMDSVLLASWSARIAKADRVYHLGDLSLAKPDRTLEILSALPGQVYLVRGNHDSVSCGARFKDKFVWVRDYEYLKIAEQYIALSHYPFLSWRNMHHGSWHLHGHCHGQLSDSFGGKRMDVGVDTNGWRPYNFDEIRGQMELREIEVVDGHVEGSD